MYYILNESNQIIAADETLLNLCGITDFNELTSKIGQGDTLMDHIENVESFSMTKTILSSTLGELTLVTLEGDAASINLGETTELADETELFTLLDDTSEPAVTEENIVEEPMVELVEEAPMDLGLDIIKESSDQETPKEEAPAVVMEDIVINIDTLSQKIGISSEDYATFLNEFIDNAIDLESDLHSSESETRNTATATLSSLANVLHLPMVGKIISHIAEEANPESLLKSFYEVLSRITTTQDDEKTETEPVEEETVALFDTPETELETTPEPESEKPKNPNGFGSISLEGIKPIHFDFQLEEAANDLSLPVELIEEFVHDFIEQAHIETKKMLEAYEEGDLDSIQKIGHLLKGASSNLRINALSDTLYKIQFTETSDNLDLLIKDYWAHFLSFENQINVISN